MSICCLCGAPVLAEEGELALEFRLVRRMTNKLTGKTQYVPVQMENGSRVRYTCPVCPAQFGAPLALVGADERNDV
jgi:hypothetical protein